MILSSYPFKYLYMCGQRLTNMTHIWLQLNVIKSKGCSQLVENLHLGINCSPSIQSANESPFLVSKPQARNTAYFIGQCHCQLNHPTTTDAHIGSLDSNLNTRHAEICIAIMPALPTPLETLLQFLKSKEPQGTSLN